MEELESALLEEIRRSPGDDSARLVYADWLSGRGDPRGEFIVLQCQAARKRARPEVRRREQALLAEHRADWLGPIEAAAPPDALLFLFERGFLLHPPAVTSEVLRDQRETLLRLSPTVYELGQVVAEGLLNRVLHGWQHGPLGVINEVALKHHLGSAGFPQEKEEHRLLLEDEGAITGRLDHPNLALALGWAYLDGEAALVLEWLDGHDLRSLLRRCAEPPGEAFAVAVMHQLCRGLQALHGAGVEDGVGLGLVHREVRPDHVMITWDGRVKLIDFGWTRCPGRRVAPEQVMSSISPGLGAWAGRLAYLSPEQVRGVPVEQRSDLFSAAAMLAELCTGRCLFQRETEFQTVLAIREGDLTELRVRSAPLRSLVKQTLQVDPARRCSSAAELAHVLAEVARVERWALGRAAVAARLGRLVRRPDP